MIRGVLLLMVSGAAATVPPSQWEALSEIFDLTDANDDGKLSAAEFYHIFSIERSKFPHSSEKDFRRMSDDMFADLDTNADRHLSSSEFLSHFRRGLPAPILRQLRRHLGRPSTSTESPAAAASEDDMTALYHELEMQLNDVSYEMEVLEHEEKIYVDNAPPPQNIQDSSASDFSDSPLAVGVGDPHATLKLCYEHPNKEPCYQLPLRMCMSDSGMCIFKCAATACHCLSPPTCLIVPRTYEASGPSIYQNIKGRKEDPKADEYLDSYVRSDIV